MPEKPATIGLPDAEASALAKVFTSQSFDGFFLVGDLQGARDLVHRALLKELQEVSDKLLDLTKGRIQQEYDSWRAKRKSTTRNLGDTSTSFSKNELLDLWFGHEPDAWRNTIWFLGIDPDAPEQGEEGLVSYLNSRTGPLYQAVLEKGLEDSPLKDWSQTADGAVALVVLFDQFPRLLYPGDPKSLQFAGQAQKAAKDALRLFEGEQHVPWAHRLFCHLALLHKEDLPTAEEASLNILRLQKTFETTKGYKGLSQHMKDTALIAQDHVSLLRRFGRYPHYNKALNRQSTDDESVWLRSKKLPSWAAKLAWSLGTKEPPKTSEGSKISKAVPSSKGRKRLRILVLHGLKTNGQGFEKRAKPIWEKLRPTAELIFIDAPHLYTESDPNAKPAPPTSRCWFTVSDVEGPVRYVGVQESIAYLEKVFKTSGPFDGVLGFSQGGCMAGILAALNKPTLPFKFCIIISAPYCRDQDLLRLHLETQPLEQKQGCVKPRAEKISMPSLHIWSAEDKQIECWRSEILAGAFKDPVVRTHDRDHISYGNWPVDEIQRWLEETIGLPDNKKTEDYLAALTGDENVATLGFVEKLRGGLTEAPSKDDLIALRAISKGNPEISKKLLAATLAAADLAAPEGVYKAIAILLTDVAADKEAKSGSDSDASPGSGAAQKNSEVVNISRAPKFPEFSNFLGVVEEWGWKSLVQLDVTLAQAMDDMGGLTAPERDSLQVKIAQFFAIQLERDAEVAAEWQRHAPQTSEQSLSDLMAWRLECTSKGLKKPSDCTREAPRFGGAAYKATHLSLRVATKMHELRTNEPIPRPRDKQRELRKMYEAVLRDVGSVLDIFDEEKVTLAKGLEKHAWRTTTLSEDAFERLKSRPLSQAVLEPIPQPVEISTKEQMQPLYDWMSSGKPFSPNINTDQVFERGTLTNDHRLDLCKQVIGPTGLSDFFSALRDENRNGGLVKHLLLGNNICGDGLPQQVADFIASGESKLTTWYIAGNRIQGDALKPLCEVLQKDTQVLQLWLKRNPLKLAGATNLATMLPINRTLQVLDVLNCGLLDAGAVALAAGLRNSTSLRHFYGDGNGLTAVGAEALAKAGGSFLYTLSLGNNRLGDEGAATVAEHCTTVTRLSLAACGISEVGAKSLVELLRRSKTLRFLDLGISKSTVALGEVPNRIADGGAVLFADVLADPKALVAPLNALILVHNRIEEKGLVALEAALKKNTSLVKLELDLLNLPGNDLLKAETRASLTKNWRALSDGDAKENAEVREALTPAHLEEIKSVYRLGNTYSPGPTD